jgi:hypothetical protein
MTAKLVIAGVVIGLVGASPCAWSQGRDFIQPFNQQRKVNIITPGSLYKNPALKQDPAASLIKPAQTDKRTAASQPQKTPSTPQLQTKAPSLDAAQPASPFAPKAQPSPFSTPPQPTPFVSVFTSSQSGQQTPPPQAPQTVPAIGQPPVVLQPSPLFPVMSATTPAVAPPPPVFAITPQFTAVSPLSPAGLPNANATAPAKQPLVTPNPPLAVPQLARPGTPQIGGASPLQRSGLTTPQIAPVLPGNATPLLPPAPSAPLATPLGTPVAKPVGTQVQQPFYVPQTPFVAPAAPQR